MKVRVKALHTAIAAVTAMAAASSGATTINLIDLGGVTGSPAEAGFKIAAKYWGNLFTNSATINLGVGFAALPAGVIGSTGSTARDLSVGVWETAINATKSASAIDSSIVLPTLNAGGVTALGAGTTGGQTNNAVTVNINGEVSARTLFVNTSVTKAIGLVPAAPPFARDGDVTFSSTFAFDFDPTNGITAGTFDFLGVAIHEIGHALGFVSGVDFYDYFGFPSGPGRGIYGDLNDTSLFSALDMFRYSAPGVLDFRTGGTKYFSVNGGTTALFGNTFSTGRFNGDGQQASHWKDTPGCLVGNGIMDPTFCFGQMGAVTGLDLAAFDAMGWNLSVNALTYGTVTTAQIYAAAVPEPETLLLMLVGLGLLGATQRKRKPA